VKYAGNLSEYLAPTGIKVTDKSSSRRALLQNQRKWHSLNGCVTIGAKRSPATAWERIAPQRATYNSANSEICSELHSLARRGFSALFFWEAGSDG
jgi:hypothetical protein